MTPRPSPRGSPHHQPRRTARWWRSTRGRALSLDRRVVVQIPVRPTKAGDTQASQRESGHYCDDYCYDDHA